MQTRALAVAFLFACGGKSSPPQVEPGVGPCVKSGCSGTVCTAAGHEVVTTCEFRPEYACYQTASCAKQADGECGWTQTQDLTACLANPPPASGGSGAPVM